MIDIITYNKEETIALGKKFASSLKGGEVIALYGDLGSGKTTFASGVINFFFKNKRVLSPTFIIVRHYYPKNKKINQLIHIDLYRLKNKVEIKDLGLSEHFRNSKNIILIEWAEKIKSMLPKKHIEISFNPLSQNTRKIIYGSSN